MGTDTKFFTNEDNNSLLERFKSTLPTTRYFDVLAGYFRSSGFGLLSDALGNVEKSAFSSVLKLKNLWWTQLRLHVAFCLKSWPLMRKFMVNIPKAFRMNLKMPRKTSKRKIQYRNL